MATVSWFIFGETILHASKSPMDTILICIENRRSNTFVSGCSRKLLVEQKLRDMVIRSGLYLSVWVWSRSASWCNKSHGIEIMELQNCDELRSLRALV